MTMKIHQSAVKTPSFFVPNHGQYQGEALFAASAKHTRFYFMKSHIIHAMALAGDESGQPTQGVALSLGFVDANPGLSVQGAEPYAGKVNYFTGSSADEWKSNIPTYGALMYSDVWEGISLAVRHTEKGVKLDWHVAPGTNPDAIRLSCEGADALSVGDDGSLVLTHEYGEVREEAPVAYQMIDGRRVDVPCGYRLDGTFSYGFWLGEGYDPAQELIIDPLLPYGSLLGGSAVDLGTAIAADAEGCAYVVGNTTSADFPVTPGAFQTTLPNANAAFVTKFSADGSQLVYSTYLGGSTDETDAFSIAVDGDGYAYVTGRTAATDFPVTAGAFQTSLGGDTDAYVTKLSQDGASLVYSTYLGGNLNDVGYSIRVDTNGIAYVGGSTSSFNFPTTPGVFQTVGNGADGFVTKLTQDGSALVYSTYLGGSCQTDIFGIGIDTAGSVYATGSTCSADFPITPGAFQPTKTDTQDAFVTKFSTDATSLVSSTYVGGNALDQGMAICPDDSGYAYVTGWTQSPNFPATPGAAQTTYGGGAYDAFVLKMSPDGTALVYCTFLGGSSYDQGAGIALIDGNIACVTGETDSSNFPTTPWVNPTTRLGAAQAFLTLVSEDGSTFVASRFVGGLYVNVGTGLAIGPEDGIYLTGRTNSSNFPVTPGAFQTTSNGDFEAFVFRTGFVRYAKASVVITKL